MRVKTITVTLDIEGRVNGLVVPEGTQVEIVNALNHETFYPCTGAGMTSYEIDPDEDPPDDGETIELGDVFHHEDGSTR